MRLLRLVEHSYIKEISHIIPYEKMDNEYCCYLFNWHIIYAAFSIQ